jgi:hypothetical protein
VAGRHPSRVAAALFLTLFVMSATGARGETAPIPADVQMLLFARIWMFDRSLATHDEVVVAVLYQSAFRASSDSKDQMILAARAMTRKVRCVPIALDGTSRIEEDLRQVNADVFYVTEMRGVDITTIVRVSRARHIKTISVVMDYIAAGVAIGLRVRNDRPDIVVNLVAAKAEGSDLTAQLLRVATILAPSEGR